MNPVKEKYLVFRARHGNKKACRKLIDEHYLPVYKFLYKYCQNKSLAQDLTQDTFTKVWQSLDQFNSNCKLRTWIIRIAYNLFIDYTRKNKKHLFPIEKYRDVILDDPISTSISKKITPKTLLSLVAELSQKLQKVILLHYLNELSLSQVAVILNIPEGTVKSRLNAALKKLRKKLNHLNIFEEQ